MTSETSIANGALAKIGAPTITDLDEGSDSANKIKARFPELRDLLLRQHPWSFATKRQKLAQSAVTPISGWAFQYRVPSDWLRTHIVSSNDLGRQNIEYRLEIHETDGRVILTDATEVWLRYIARITDPQMMPVDFHEALSCKIATEIAMSIAQSNTIRDSMEVQLRVALAEAKSVDGIEDFPEQLPLGTWAGVRNRRGGTW